MITKHLKIFYSFFLKRKFFTIVILITTIAILSLDYIAISVIVYKFFNLLNREEKPSVFNTLAIIMLLRFLLQSLIFYSKEYSLRNNIIINLKKNFSSIENNIHTIEYNTKREQILKIQLKIISNITIIENYYFKMIDYSVGNISILFFIVPSLFSITLIKSMTLLMTLVTHLLIILIFKFQSTSKKGNSYLVDKELFMANKLLAQHIENKNFSIKEYRNTINNHIKSLKKLFVIICIKNFSFEIIIYLLRFCQFLLLLYFILQTNISESKFIKSNSLCFIFYNLIYTYFSTKITKLFYTMDIDDLINSINFITNNVDVKINRVGVIELIEFQKVTLTTKDYILSDINLKVMKKQNVCFISNQKSISLIRMIFDNKETKICGDILINQISIFKYNINLIKENIVTINSSPFIKFGTIKDNINIDNLQLSDELIIQACKLSGFYDYVISNTAGYLTEIENSTQIKKIEKFQLSFTRALLSNGQIIIIDFLDINEDDIQIHKLKDILISNSMDRIIIFITQNAYRLEEMDNIIIVENNQIIATGLHNSLLQSSLLYSNFYLKNRDEEIFTD